MLSETFSRTIKDVIEILVYKWFPDENIKPKAAVQIAHGMAEHAER